MKEIIWHKTGRILGAYRFAYDDAGRASLEELHAEGWAQMELANAAAGGGESGATALSELTDVALTALAPGQVLKWNGDAWANGVDLQGTGGGLADADYGDIVVTAGGSDWRVEAGAISLAKMQARSEATFIGREAGAGAGTPQEITGAEAFTILGLGTAATRNVPAAGNAGAAEVVLGTDGRLSDARAPTTHSHTTAQVTGLDAALATIPTTEAMQDLMAAMLTAGGHTNVTVTYDDNAGTIQLAAAGGGAGLTQEQAEDIVAAQFAAGVHTGVSFAYNDTTGALSATVVETGQPLDATLTALAGLNATAGLVEQTAADTFTKRLLGVGAATSIPTRADADTRYAAASHAHAQADVTGLVTDLGNKQGLDATLTALAGLNATAGIVEQTGTDAFTKRALGVAAATSIPTRADADTRYAAAAHTHAQADVTGLVTALATIPTTEVMQDLVGSMFSAGGHSNLTAVYNDTAGTVELSATGGGGGLTQEQAEDIVAAQLAAGTHTGISFAYNDTSGAISATVSAGGVADGDKGEITVTGGVWTIDAGVVTLAKQANLAADTIIGRANAAGTGVPQALTATQVRTIINVANGATANDTDANLKARGNHTGTDTPASIAFAASDRLLGRATAGAGTGEEITCTAAGRTFLAAVDAAGQRTATGAAAASHTHAQADVTNLVTDLAAKQTGDATLTALAGLNATAGIVEQTGADAFTKRPFGVAAATDIPTRADADTRYAAAAHSHNTAEITGLDTALTGKQAADATLTALAGLNSTAGVVEQTGADAFTKRPFGVGGTTSVLTRADGDGRYLGLAGGTMTGGVKAPGGTVTGALSSAAHSGGVFTTTGNVTIPNEAGFSATLIAGGAHTVGAGGAALALATGDMLSVVIPAAGTVRAVKVLAADVLTMATS